MANQTLKTLSFLLPAGVLGVSMTLAGAPASALPLSPEGAAAASGQNPGVAARLRAIRDGVSDVVGQSDGDSISADFPNVLKAWWRNFRNGGGWHRRWFNGGWHRGWRNGGGWRNFRNW
ncbi:GrrA/OscA1 family cyclophane-containing rSAM-modified RiPP [Methylocella sp.]|jgi:rSAM-associated Gly-rich repeat protein|uniref:GrrA/OscA1 family cyclophane-containing rSAM-modified RiPP n=1 Tax=Methylocella sp. TaxID=1978226 RepID=UPI003C299F98